MINVLKVWDRDCWRFYAAGAREFAVLSDNPEAAITFSSWSEAFEAWRTRLPDFNSAQIVSR